MAGPLDELTSRAGSMLEWLKLPETDAFFRYLRLSRELAVQSLAKENEMWPTARLQGDVQRLDKILRIPQVLRDARKGGT